jgi:hypothetical protein
MFAVYIYSCGVQQNWFFLFFDFPTIYYYFLKDLAKINKKDKDKTAFENRLQQVRKVKRTVIKVRGGGLSGFRVQGEKNRLTQKLREVMWTFFL